MEERCNLDGTTLASRWQQRQGVTTTVFVGGNMPQMDVNRLGNQANAVSVVDAVFDKIQAFAGWDTLDKDVILFYWGLTSPEKQRTLSRREAHAAPSSTRNG